MCVQTAVNLKFRTQFAQSAAHTAQKKHPMKKKADPRHKLRVETVKKLFEQSFRKNIDFDKGSEAEKISASQKKIDTLVEKFAPSWPIEQILPMDLAILRLSIWELAFKEKKEPYKVIVDEAVEIAKEYGTETSGGFINGVLGAIIKTYPKLKRN